jgi:SpoVK/Ycf46/Vps4 family AAA+-type ATPase
MEVSYLLQRMETYRGLAILTTNLSSGLDAAFLRRLRFILRFPFPDSGERAEIWRRAFPADTPTDGLDPVRLASLQVAGGAIRNIALGAAFHAAEAGAPVSMAHVLAATLDEAEKQERPLMPAEVDGWT